MDQISRRNGLWSMTLADANNPIFKILNELWMQLHISQWSELLSRAINTRDVGHNHDGCLMFEVGRISRRTVVLAS